MGLLVLYTFIWILLELYSAEAQAESCQDPEFFQQRVWHTETPTGAVPAANTTFNQQYQIQTDNFEPGGPILFYMGGENYQMVCIEETILPTWASEMNGLAATLEHRFFGQSIPANGTDAGKQFQSLTLENVMGDAVEFVKYIKNTVPGANNSQVIVHGGSYSAFLSAVMRLNYPDIFFGSIAWSAVLTSTGPDEQNPYTGADEQNPYKFDFWTACSNVYSDYSATAASKIRDTFPATDHLFNDMAYAEYVATAFNVCKTPTTVDALQELKGDIIESYAYNAQYNSGGRVVSRVVNETLVSSTPEGILNASLREDTFNETTGKYDCYDLGGPIDAEPPLAYEYLTCRYYQIPAAEIPNGTIFPWDDTDGGNTRKICKEKFNITSLPTDVRLEEEYHYTPKDIDDTPRILFTYGEYDPYHVLGATFLYPEQPSTDRGKSRAVLVSGMSHTEDCCPPQKGFTQQSVVDAQNMELQTLKVWLGIS